MEDKSSPDEAKLWKLLIQAADICANHEYAFGSYIVTPTSGVRMSERRVNALVADEQSAKIFALLGRYAFGARLKDSHNTVQ